MGALQDGWEGYQQDLTLVCKWFEKGTDLHISILEMWVVIIALSAFEDYLFGGSLVLMSNNSAYLNKYTFLCIVTLQVFVWAEPHAMEMLAGSFSLQDQVILTEWSRLPWVFDKICC